MQATEWQTIVDAIGATVRDVRRLLGWSQQYLADIAVVSQGTISRLERGECAAVPFHSVVVVIRTLAVGALSIQLPLSPDAERLLAFAPSLNGDFAAVQPVDPLFAEVAQLMRELPRPRRGAFLRLVRDAAILCGDYDG